jgi:hypothetical protein
LLALASLILQSGLDVPARAVKEMVSRAIQIVVQLTQLPDHSHKVMEIAEVEGLDYDCSVEFPPYKLHTLYRFEFSHYGPDRKALGQFTVPNHPSWLRDLKMIPDYQVPDFWEERRHHATA